MTTSRKAALALCAIVAASAAAPSAQVLIPIRGNAGGALDYETSSDSFVVVTHGSASGPALEKVTVDGVRFRFGTAAGWPEEAPLAVVQQSNAFDEGHVFTARGAAGRIVRLSASGRVLADPWISLPGERGIVTALAFSRGAPFGEDLIVGTAGGNVWRVDEHGRSSLVAATGYPIRAVLPLPADPRYGAAAGTILAATGAPKCQLLTIDAAGLAAPMELGGCITDLDLVVPATDLFVTGVAAADGKTAAGLVKFPAISFEGFSCDVLITDDKGSLGLVNPGVRALFPSIVRGTEGVRAARSAFADSAIRCQPEVCGDDVDNNGNGETDEACPEPCEDDEACPENFEMPAQDAARAAPVQAGCPAERWAARPGAWTALDPKQQVAAVFAVPAFDELQPLARETLLALLTEARPGASGLAGDSRRLAAAGVAALLNAGHSSVGYPLAASAIADHVNAALASGHAPRIQALAGVLEAYNALGCRLPVN